MLDDIPLWALPFTGLGLASTLIVLAVLLCMALSPGEGWTLSCTFGHPGCPAGEIGPCFWQIGPRRRFPEWTKHMRHRIHWWRRHTPPDAASRRWARLWA